MAPVVAHHGGMPELLVRLATAADVEALVDTHMASRAQAMPWLPVQHRRDEMIAWMSAVVLPAQSVWVAELGNRHAGYMALAPRGQLEQLYVLPEHQGKGIGSKLLDKAKELSPEGLSLYVFQRNVRARSFYEAHGFLLAELTGGAANQEHEPDARYLWPGSPAGS